ncbi:MAG TPA: hypothetical protein DEF32_17825 [Hydrogenophaga sp.]|nr:hypothetical protein [Hydrogenophaga sp.]
MSNEEMRVFDEEIKDAKYYLEFGLGGSTIRAIQRSKAIIHTVESSTDWVKEMRRYLLVRQHEKRRLRIFSVDIGPVLEWGYPKSDNFKNSFETYSSGIFQSIDCSQIDLILVDGRFRVACTLKSILECQVNSSVKILIHDFWNRPQYHTVLQYLDIVKKVDTIGLFSIKNGIDRESLLRDYEVYKLIPE